MKHSLRITVDDLTGKVAQNAAAELADFARAAGELLYMGGVSRLWIRAGMGAPLGRVSRQADGLALCLPAGIFPGQWQPTDRFYVYFRLLAHAFNRSQRPPDFSGPQGQNLAEFWQVYLEYYACRFARQAVAKLFPDTGPQWAPPLPGEGSPAMEMAAAWASPPAPGLVGGPGLALLVALCASPGETERAASRELRKAMDELFAANRFQLAGILPLYLTARDI